MKKQSGAVIFFMLFASVMSFRGPAQKYLPPRNNGAYGNSYGSVPSQQYLAPHNNRNLHYKAVTGLASSAGFQRQLSSAPRYNSAAAQIPIIRQDYTSDAIGNYIFGFETANGIKRNEAGDIRNIPESSLNVKGSYSYTGDDGRKYTVNYRADENGFHAEGDHLPTSPPVIEQGFAGGYRKYGSPAYHSQALHQSSSNSYSPTNRYLPPHRH